MENCGTEGGKQASLRRLQVALAVTKCIHVAAEYGDEGIDFADAIAGVLVLLEPIAASLDCQEGKR